MENQKIPDNIKLFLLEKEVEIKAAARKEAEKGRNQAIGVLSFIALALGIAAAFGINSMISKYVCLLYTSPSPRDATLSRMPSSA